MWFPSFVKILHSDQVRASAGNGVTVFRYTGSGLTPSFPIGSTRGRKGSYSRGAILKYFNSFETLLLIELVCCRWVITCLEISFCAIFKNKVEIPAALVLYSLNRIVEGRILRPNNVLLMFRWIKVKV